MTFEEAIEAMNNDQKVYRKYGLPRAKFYFDRRGILQCERDGQPIPVYLSVDCFNAEDWEAANEKK